MDSDNGASATEANRLYWETDLPVGEIAERLDISRRALYEAIQPRRATGRCARCGGELEYTNRSTRTHGFASCRNCGQQTASTGEPEPWTWSPPSTAAPPARPPARDTGVWLLGGAALAGALLGAAATLAITHRD